MPSLNKIILIGRLTRDPDVRYAASGTAIASFSIAVDRKRKDQNGEKKTDFFRCKAFGKTAEVIQSWVKKGRLVAVDGSVEINEYEKDGERKTSFDIVCESFEVLDRAQETEEQPAAPPQQRPAAQPPRPPKPAPVQPALVDDDDPFGDE